MTNDKRSLLAEAESAAQNVSVTGWFFLGLLATTIGLLIAYLRSPKTPIRLSVNWEGDDRYVFEQAYSETLKANQVKATWWGFLAGILLLVLLIGGFYGFFFWFMMKFAPSM
ncbi:MAG: hypothetical protein F4120_02155 [Rhodothermaceae bacterium]|nr:hypothetical protein [Bacteroidota bacterium]MXW14072.1 hypothetical protein [Rhodothermaceae bacterium]MXW33120.1 hypothetical protein [Rhodothermaceae bacterium]MYC03596.1 hypothetical protein [Rhodothermaceae bacterium]MYE64281.1 hypothetical protein [Rhodothermaceae bacterium]